MSRIDKAIEMAAKINSSAQTVPRSKAEIKTAPVGTGFDDVATLTVNNPYLVTLNEPHGIAAEEYNKLRANVLHLTKSEPKKNTLLITSAVPGEGKTLTAVNLALTLARTTDHTVMLVDADFRRPTLHKLLNIETDIGFAQCLRDNLPLEKALVKTGLGKLVVLPAGQQIDEPLELLSSKYMQRLIRETKERYPDRYVIFDSPPVLPFADARVMATFMDGIIFVTRENYSQLDHVREGLESLHDCHVMGVLCNDTSLAKEHKYGNYY